MDCDHHYMPALSLSDSFSPYVYPIILFSVILLPMASLTVSPKSVALPLQSGGSTTLRIEPPGGLLELAIGFAILSIFCFAYGILPSIAAFWLPILLLLALFTALGVGLWLSALNALYRDVRYVIPFLVQFWMFASPVAYPSSIVPARWRWLYGLNPMAGVIDGFRWAITGRGEPPGLVLLVSTVAVLLVVLGGLFFFNRMETSIADRV